MKETIRPSGVIRFGVFEVDLPSEELRKSGLKLKFRKRRLALVTRRVAHRAGQPVRVRRTKQKWIGQA